MNTENAQEIIDPRKCSVVLYDGMCKLCAGSIKFIIRRDPKGRYAFAALQSETAGKLLDSYGIPRENLDTFVLVEGGRAFDRSDAALRVARHLSGLWPIFSILLAVPRPIRNWFYNHTAKHRYRWFGRRASCLLSTPEHSDRFLDQQSHKDQQRAAS